MASLTEMFQMYLADLFPKEAEFAEDGAQRLRIIYPIRETVPGHRYSRPIVLVFEPHVIDEFRGAVDDGNVPRQDRIGDALCEIVRGALNTYDVHGSRDSGFTIRIDSEATDL